MQVQVAYRIDADSNNRDVQISAMSRIDGKVLDLLDPASYSHPTITISSDAAVKRVCQLIREAADSFERNHEMQRVFGCHPAPVAVQ